MLRAEKQFAQLRRLIHHAELSRLRVMAWGLAGHMIVHGCQPLMRQLL